MPDPVSVRLAEIEARARHDAPISGDDAMFLVRELRRYMAMSVEVEASVQRMTEYLAESS